MFGWFKKKPTHDPGNKQFDEFQQHIAKAEGPLFVRSMIASAMGSAETDSVAQERNRRPATEQLHFMLTYECFVAYALRIGVERIAKPGSFENARIAIERHYAKHAYFEPIAYAKISQMLDAVMMASTEMDANTLDTPICRLLLAALNNQSFFPSGIISEFKVHLSFELQQVASFAENTTASIVQKANQLES